MLPSSILDSRPQGHLLLLSAPSCPLQGAKSFYFYFTTWFIFAPLTVTLPKSQVSLLTGRVALDCPLTGLCPCCTAQSRALVLPVPCSKTITGFMAPRHIFALLPTSCPPSHSCVPNKWNDPLLPSKTHSMPLLILISLKAEHE